MDNQQPVTNWLSVYADKLANVDNNGKIMRLPTWGGFWFMVNQRVYVFTHDGLLLDTPHFDKYKDNTDWIYEPMTKEQAITIVKAIRQNINALRTHALELLKPMSSPELAMYSTDMQYGFMYLGYVLSEMGETSPYVTSFDPKSPIIEKHADVDSFAAEIHVADSLIAAGDNTAKVKWMRKEISNLISFFSWFTFSYNTNGYPIKYKAVYPFVDFWSHTVLQLTRANMALGLQLNNIRIEAEKEANAEIFNQLEKNAIPKTETIDRNAGDPAPAALVDLNITWTTMGAMPHDYSLATIKIANADEAALVSKLATDIGSGKFRAIVAETNQAVYINMIIVPSLGNANYMLKLTPADRSFIELFTSKDYLLKVNTSRFDT